MREHRAEIVELRYDKAVIRFTRRKSLILGLAAFGAAYKVTPERCFSGFDAYQKVIDSDVDLVLRIMEAYLSGDYTSAPNSSTSAVYLTPDYDTSRPVLSANVSSVRVRGLCTPERAPTRTWTPS